jgi:hypothetical protein
MTAGSIAMSGGADAAGILAALLDDAEPTAVRVAALVALRTCGTHDVAESIRERFPKMNGAVQAAAAELLLSRKAWAASLLAAVEAGRVAPAMITLDQVRQVALYQERQLDAIVRKHWGSVTGGTPEAKLADAGFPAERHPGPASATMVMLASRARRNMGSWFLVFIRF